MRYDLREIESLVLAFALTHSGSDHLAEKFLKGQYINTDEARKAFARRLGLDVKTTLNELDRHYRRLSSAAHPSLEMLALRTIRSKSGRPALAAAVPERVICGGFLSSELARVSLLGLAENVWGALRLMPLVIRETSGAWASDTGHWHRRLQDALDADESEC